MKLWWPEWEPSALPGAVDDVPGTLPEAAVAGEEALLALPGEEAEVLALGLFRDREAVTLGDLPHLRLAEMGEREAEPPQQLRRQRREHVALVLGVVVGGGQQRPVAVVDDPRVVAGDQTRGAEARGEVEHRRDPNLAVADDARVRCRPGGVAGEEGADHPAPEVLLEVEGEVRDVDRVGDRAGAEHRLGRAAGLRPVGLRIGPELDRDPDDFRAPFALEQRGDGAVHASRHRHRDPFRRARRQGPLRGRGDGEPAVQGVGGEHGGVALGRGQAAEGGFDLVGADPGGAEHRLSVDHLDGRGGRPPGSRHSPRCRS